MKYGQIKVAGAGMRGLLARGQGLLRRSRVADHTREAQRRVDASAGMERFTLWLVSGAAGETPASFTVRQQRALAASRRVARIMDVQWGISRYRIGADTLLELAPWVGDVLSSSMLLFQLRVARTLNLPRTAFVHMMSLAAISFLIGLIPIVGVLFNTLFKAHVRIQRVIERHVRKM